MVFHVLRVQKIAAGRLSDLDDDAAWKNGFARSKMRWRTLRDQGLDSRAAVDCAISLAMRKCLRNMSGKRDQRCAVQAQPGPAIRTGSSAV
jgi:hypothetical protein